MNKHIYCGINQQLQGFYKIGVYNPNTDEVKWHEEGKNLILNQGMDHIYDASIVDQMLYGVSGVGTRVNSINGGTSQITQSGATVYLNIRTGLSDFTSSTGGHAAAAQIGDMLQYANNSESMVTSVSANGFNLAVTPSYTFTSGQTFIVWKTSQIGLQTEISRSTSYVGGSGNCGSTVVGNVVTHRRTYDFPLEISPQSYNEIGIAWATTLPTTMFSRVLLVSPVAVPAGFNLRLLYDLQSAWWPTSSIYATASIGGWPVAPSTSLIGSGSLQTLLTSTINVADGASIVSTAMLDPYYYTPYFGMWASTNSQSLATFGSAVDRSSGADYVSPMTKAAYIASSYYADKTGVFTTAQLISNSIRSVGLGRVNTGAGYYPYESSHQVYCFVFNQPQTKYITQTLGLTFRSTWARTLA